MIYVAGRRETSLTYPYTSSSSIARRLRLPFSGIHLLGYTIPVNDAISRKLGQQYAGLFTVAERVGRLAYKLDLPPTWKVHPVISVQHLEPAPSPGSFNREPPEAHPTYDPRYL
jgi:hypothetical protein